MFDNRFTRKDPLAESVRQVMIENDIRRQVELTLNEQLGIQSRKQLPHELHESYDATLNAAINNALNEGCSWSKGKMEEESEGSEPRNEKERKLAAMKPPYNKITHADVLKGRGVIAQEEMNVALGKNPITRKDPNAPQAMQEKLTKKMSAGDVISDFVHSKNPKFAGKSKKERQRMALGAYYSKHPEKSRKKMDESVQSILEEIRDNLEEQFVYVYENGNYAMMEQFLASLTEEQAELLGLSEDAGPNDNRSFGQKVFGYKPLVQQDRTKQGLDPITGNRLTPTPSTSSTPPAAPGLATPPGADAFDKIPDSATMQNNVSGKPSIAPAAPATTQPTSSATKVAERPAPAERPQRQQRSSDSGSSFSGPTGRAGFGDRGSDFGG